MVVSIARALFSVSSHSFAGTESATIPAPACTDAGAVGDDARADGDREINSPVTGRDVADRAGVRPASLGLELIDDLHRAHLGRSRHGAGRECC
jgi:hypothetical protein